MATAKAEKKMTAAPAKQPATAPIAKELKNFQQNAAPAGHQELPLMQKQPDLNRKKFSVFL